MKWAIINNDIVENIIEYDGVATYIPNTGNVLEQINDWVNIGDNKNKQNVILEKQQ